MRHKIRDKVRIRSDLEVNVVYRDYRFFEQMERYIGKIMTIAYVGEDFYLMEEDMAELGYRFYWTDGMIELEVEEEQPIITNFEHYRDKLLEYQKEVGSTCELICELREKTCSDYPNVASCGACAKSSIEWLFEEYKEPIKIELTQFEYDLLSTVENQRFSSNKRNRDMKEKGYFKGVYDVDMKVQDILNNSIIIDSTPNHSEFLSILNDVINSESNPDCALREAKDGEPGGCDQYEYCDRCLRDSLEWLYEKYKEE